jgi:hypothetical protein
MSVDWGPCPLRRSPAVQVPDYVEGALVRLRAAEPGIQLWAWAWVVHCLVRQGDDFAAAWVRESHFRWLTFCAQREEDRLPGEPGERETDGKSKPRRGLVPCRARQKEGGC